MTSRSPGDRLGPYEILAPLGAGVLGLRYTSAVALLVTLVEVGEVAPELRMDLLGQLERFGRYAPRILEDAAGRIRAARKGGWR